MDAARQALRKVLSGVALPAGISLDDLAYPAVLAVLSEVYQHPGLFPGAAAAAGRGLRPSGADAADAPRNLVNRTQMAARLDVNISTVMSWIERYEDFPGPARTDTPVPQWWWPDVEAYCEANHLPRHKNLAAARDAEQRDAKILEILTLFPEGLTTAEIAALSGEEEAEDSPTANAVQVRYEDRLRRQEASGIISHAQKAGTYRSPYIWKLVAGATGAGDPTASARELVSLGFPAKPAAAATPPPSSDTMSPATTTGRNTQARPGRPRANPGPCGSRTAAGLS